MTRLTPLVLSLTVAVSACNDWSLFRRDGRDDPTDETDLVAETCPALELPGGRLDEVDCMPRVAGWAVRELWRAPLGHFMGVLPRTDSQPGSWVVLVDTGDTEWVVRAVDGRTGEATVLATVPGFGAPEYAYTNPRTSKLEYYGRHGVPGLWSRISQGGALIAQLDEEGMTALQETAKRSCLLGVAGLGYPSRLGDGPEVFFYSGPIVLDEALEMVGWPGRSTLCYGIARDTTGDGLREIVDATGVYRRNGTPACLVDLPEGAYGGTRPVVIDLDQDGSPEWQSGISWVSGEAFGTDQRVYNADCTPYPFEFETPPSLESVERVTIDTAAPMLDADRVSVLAHVQGFDFDGVRQVVSVLYDHELQVVREFEPLGLRPRAADLDGDGLFEVLADGYPVGRSRVIDPRTGDLLLELPEGWMLLPVDLDGDGHIELLNFSGSEAVPNEIVAYNAADGEWAWGAANWQGRNGFDHYPRLYDPDGSLSPPERDRTARMGWYNALPNDGHLRGAYAELTVRIAEVCDAECDRDWLTVWVHPGNAGQRDVERPVRVVLGGTVGGVERVLDEVVVETLPAGTELRAVELNVEGAGALDALWARIEPDGWRWEGCTQQADVHVWDGETCPE